MYVYVCVCVYIYIYMCVCVYIYIYIYNVCVCMYIYICVCVCVCVCIYIYIYLQIYKLFRNTFYYTLLFKNFGSVRLKKNFFCLPKLHLFNYKCNKNLSYEILLQFKITAF